MRYNFDKEACPVCESETYDCADYEEDFNGEEAWQRWRCHCNECGCMFDMERIYQLIDVSVSLADGN